MKLLLLFLIFNYNFLLPSKTVFAETNSPELDNNSTLNNDYYLLGPGDILEIKIYDLPEKASSYQVSNDGTINLPLVGNVNVNNLTIETATKELKKIFSEELLRPELYLKVISPRPIKISIVGEISRPGLYSLSEKEVFSVTDTKNTNSGLPTLVDAIQKAGGITQDANLKEVLLRRRLPGTNHEYKEAKLDLLSLITNGEQSQNLYLFDGDIIFLQKAEEFNSQIIRDSKSNLSPETISVFIIGKVNRPQKYQIKSNTPLVQALYQAGGPIKYSANHSDVELVRINDNGTISKKSIKINLKKPLSKNNNPPLKEGDIIRVKSNIYDNVTGGFAKVTEPLSGVLQLFTLLKLLE